jgi:hypothetical protein
MLAQALISTGKTGFRLLGVGHHRAEKIFVFGLFLALSACVSLPAQTFSLITGREPVTSLDGLWRFHTSDNPAWADPNFDDSSWPLVRSDESWTKQGYPAFNGYAWYRFKIEVPGDGRSIDLFLYEIVNGYQVYANGKLIGSAGAAVATSDPTFASPAAMFPLPTAGKGKQSIQIALRVWTYRPIASWFGAGSLSAGNNEAGDPVQLSQHLQFVQSIRALYYVNEYAYGLFAGLIGLAILGLFLLRPADKEYLWFSVLLLPESADVALHLMLNLGSLPFPLWRALSLICRASSVIAALAFFSTVLHARRNFLWWSICFAAAASPLTAGLIYLQWTGVGISFAIAEACVLPASAWVIAQLLLGTFRKDISARLLLIPVLLSYGINFLDLVARIAWQLGGTLNFPVVDIDLAERPFPISLGSVIDFIFILALLIFLMRRFSLARKEEERLAAEFEAAKTIQSLLIPAETPATPGFAVESMYLPAQEVGGDFFQVLPGDDGSLLIVVGDVSGKGLKAAMTVSTILGALRGCTLRTPAAVLAYLNRALHGQVTGFFTCCAALIDGDGHLTIANAGHLPPYLNGEELAVAHGLPLGIADEDEYTEKTWRLGAGDRLTIVSDGVVEARDASGELYGFGRTRSISGQPASTIARTAQQFGQEDDITVLSVTREAALEAVGA